MTPTRTIFSLKARSIRLIGAHLRWPGPTGQVRDGTVPTRRLGPLKTATPSGRSSTSAAPPGWLTVTFDPTRPQWCKAAAAATEPVPQASVSPTPLSHTRIVTSSRPGPRATNSTFTPPVGSPASRLSAGPSVTTSTVRGSGPSTTR